jgi:hypothetical protein
MLKRNGGLYGKARAVGGTRYPIGSLDFTTTMGSPSTVQSGHASKRSSSATTPTNVPRRASHLPEDSSVRVGATKL